MADSKDQSKKFLTPKERQIGAKDATTDDFMPESDIKLFR